MNTIDEIEIQQRRDYMDTLKGCTRNQLCNSLLDLHSNQLKANDSFEFINNKKDEAIDLLEEENKVMSDFITQVYEGMHDKRGRLSIQEEGIYQTMKTILNK